MAVYLPRVISNSLSESEIQRIEQLYETLEWSTNDQTDVGVEYRHAMARWLTPTAIPPELMEALRHVFGMANLKYGFEVSQIEESVAIFEYPEGGYFDWHVDTGEGITSRRKMTLSILLTPASEFDGGDLEFCPGGKMQCELRRGTATVFPSFCAHRVTPILRGKRRTLVAWMSGSPFE